MGWPCWLARLPHPEKRSSISQTMKVESVLTILLATLVVAACATPSPVAPTQMPDPLPYPAVTSSPATTNPTVSRPTSTAIQLPFDDSNVENEYCQSPEVELSIPDSQGLSEDEIAAKLMDLWLAYFNAPQAPDYCRIDGYHIDKVYYDDRAQYLPLEPRGDFMRKVRFSIRLIQVPNFWMSWAGEIDRQNWLHTGNNLAVFRSNDAYTMKFAYP